MEETGVRDGGGWTDGLVAVCHASGSTCVRLRSLRAGEGCLGLGVRALRRVRV